MAVLMAVLMPGAGAAVSRIRSGKTCIKLLQVITKHP
jgi:hypothetical protein